MSLPCWNGDNWPNVDIRKVMQTVEEHYGNPVDITKQAAGGLALNASDQ